MALVKSRHRIAAEAPFALRPSTTRLRRSAQGDKLPSAQGDKLPSAQGDKRRSAQGDKRRSAQGDKRRSAQGDKRSKLRLLRLSRDFDDLLGLFTEVGEGDDRVAFAEPLKADAFGVAPGLADVADF